MGKTAFLFPGQGAQYVGMGSQIYKKYEIARKIFDEGNDCLNMDMTKVCFEGPDEALIKTEITQPAIVITSIALLKIIEQLGIQADFVAGLSLGEYTALVCSGAITYYDAVKLVNKRGKFMQEAVPEGKGTMAAIVGMDRSVLEEVLEKAKQYGVVEGANYNCPGQIVISGEVKSVNKACELAKEQGARKAIVLPVSAPFHCSMLKPAGVKLERELKMITFNNTNIKVISNVTAEYIRDRNHIKELLIQQVHKPVLWQDTIELMLEKNVDTFIEIGPGKTLTGFTKKTAKKLGKKVKCFNIEDLESLDKISKELA